MRFQVPQFINIEDRLFGPLTVKQFIYVVGGVAMIYIIYHFLPFYFAIFLIVPIAALSLALAFLKVGGKPFVFTVQAAIVYAFSSRLYLWKQASRKVTAPADLVKESASPVPALSQSKLKELTWALDVKENVKK